MHLRWISLRGLPLLPWEVAQALNIHARDLLLHPGLRDLVLFNLCGWHVVLWHRKGNLLVLVDSREALVWIILLLRGHPLIVAGMDFSPASAPLPRKMEEIMLLGLICLLHRLSKWWRMSKHPSVKS
jgi:hypothetical protein